MGTLIVIAPSVRTIVAMISRDDNRDHCVGILGERALRAVVAGAARVLDLEEPPSFSFPAGWPPFRSVSEPAVVASKE